MPVVLAGPILRAVAPDSVTVWIALKESRTPTLSVYRGTGAARTKLLAQTRKTIAVGEHLHVVALEAKPVGAEKLVDSQLYYYDIDLGNNQTLKTAGVAAAQLTYGQDDLPTLALPPKDIGSLRVVHASCRKPHAPGWDALPVLDDWISDARAKAGQDNAKFAVTRPHLLLLTGDQIYADDVADALLALLTEMGTFLLGWEEKLPGLTAPNNVPEKLLPGTRAATSLTAGFTSAIPEAINAKSHLLGLGEFYAMYLFAWSNALWPSTVTGAEKDPLSEFRAGLPKVQRALANIPTYMIFDDHEITDDWYMSREWCNRVLDAPLGRRVVTNALLAYALFQAWGNRPGLFAQTGAGGEAGRKLLQATEVWKGGTDQAQKDALAEIERRVGLPASAPTAGTSLAKPPDALEWHYRVGFPQYPWEIVVLDCRTAREYPPRANASSTADDGRPPALLSAAAFSSQIDGLPAVNDDGLTVVVSPAPFLGVPFIAEFQDEAAGNDVWARDVESWELHPHAWQLFLAKILMRRARVVVLSGDVHYSFTARIGYAARRPYGTASNLSQERKGVLAQLTSSALKNQFLEHVFGMRSGTVGLHQLGFRTAEPLKSMRETTDWVGWAQPIPASMLAFGTTKDLVWLRHRNRSPSLINYSLKPASAKIKARDQWRYRVRFLRGAPYSQTLPAGLQATAADRRQRTKDLQQLAGSYARTRENNYGREFVGVNNICEVKFKWPTSADKSVTQHVWWRLSAVANFFPLSRFEMSLDPNDPADSPPDPVWSP